jgi:DNA-binding NarL/FixJ family response regulator
VEAGRGQAERAARLYGAAAALRERVDALVAQWERPAHERRLAAVRATLGPAAFDAAWAAGAALPLPAAIAEALVSADAVVASSKSPTTPDPHAALDLTPREAEVLRLVVRGLTDREIAAALFLSPRTVQGHVANLLGKLGVDSRAAAAYAVRQGLA